MKKQFSTPSLLVVLWILLYGHTAAFCRPAAKGKTNVIIIITDDQGYGDLSCHGNPWLKTPHLDRLHAQSTRLTDFHVSPTCAPTRAALMTGHYTNRTGAWHTIAGRSLLRKSEMTMPEVFAANGYATGIFGKWHLGDNYPFRPQDRGFQEVLVHGGGGVGQQADFWDNDYFNDTYLHNGKPEKFAGYCTDVWFDNALKFMEDKRQKNQPFFCYLATNSPHSPFHVANKYSAPYQDNPAVPVPAFNGMIANIDENLGKLMSYLKANKLEEQTLLVFMTDNGTSSGVKFTGQGSEVEKGFNAGMRGIKGSMYEGGHRVPCFIRWPEGKIAAGKDVNVLSAHIDLLPTMIDMLALKTPAQVAFDGRSLKDILLGRSKNPSPRTLITDSQRLEQPVKWRQSAVMHGSWRLINGKELYNLASDPGQQNDLALQHPKMVEQLRQDYEKWWQDVSQVFKEAPAIELCPSQEPVTILRTHDMHTEEGYDMVPWNHQQVREGMKSKGWYAVHVSEPATFKITLMRWAPEAGASLLAPLPARPALPGTTVKEMRAGKSLKIQQAGILLNGERQQKAVPASAAEGISFEVPVKAGHHKLQAWFTDEAGDSFAAYYVKVEKI